MTMTWARAKRIGTGKPGTREERWDPILPSSCEIFSERRKTRIPISIQTTRKTTKVICWGEAIPGIEKPTTLLKKESASPFTTLHRCRSIQSSKISKGHGIVHNLVQFPPLRFSTVKTKGSERTANPNEGSLSVRARLICIASLMQ